MDTKNPIYRALTLTCSNHQAVSLRSEDRDTKSRPGRDQTWSAVKPETGRGASLRAFCVQKPPPEAAERISFAPHHL